MKMRTVNIRTKRKIISALRAYGKNLAKWSQTKTKLSPKRANVFLLGTIFGRSINADRVWEAAEWICDSMGDDDDPSIMWKTFKTIEPKRLRGFLRYGYGGYAFHRHYKTLSRQIPEAANHILENYDGDPRKIWNNQRDIFFVRQRLDAIPGIGPALSRMAVLTLARDMGLLGGKKAKKKLEPKPDVHVKRVFKRTGLTSRRSTFDDVIKVAKEFCSDFPAVLDFPSWTIGRNWCTEKRAQCRECPIDNVCPKLNG
jgi:endonuclease-3